MFRRNAGFQATSQTPLARNLLFGPPFWLSTPPEYIRQFHVEQPGYMLVKSVLLSGR